MIVRPAIKTDIQHIYEHIHSLDKQELDALHRDPLESLTFGFDRSSPCVTAISKDEMLCMAGVVPMENGGVLWIITTQAVDRHQTAFLRASRKFVSEARARYPRLENMIDARNDRLVAWCRWLGFTLSEPFDYNGYPFIHYHV